MLELDRRSFIKMGAMALGANMFNVMPLNILQASNGFNETNAKIYTVFFNIAPSKDDSSKVPVSNEEIIQHLQKDCTGVDFVVRDLSKSAKMETVLKEIKDLRKQDFDGVMIYGWPRDYQVLRSGLPTINISIINDFMNVPFPIYPENKVVPAFLDPWKFTRSTKVLDCMYHDLVGKIKLIKALKRFKGAKILTVTDSPFVNVIYGDVLKHPPSDYNERILEAIYDSFTVKVIKIGTNEVCEDPEIKKLWYEESREVNDLANIWIKNAEQMINTIEEEVVKSAKCYFAMKRLMKKYDATAMAFHIRTLKKDPKPEENVYPALATSEFQKEGIVAKCQSHLNILLSEMALQFAYGVPSMLGDYAVDLYNNTSSVQHCEGPWNPWGGEKTVPYIITDHRERRVRERSRPGVGAGSWILYPADEPVTIWQLDVLRKEILFHRGKTIPMAVHESQYEDHFWEMM
jgi:hypothetical protein